MAGGKAAAEARAVTAVAVRCSAWLGDVRLMDELSVGDIGINDLAVAKEEAKDAVVPASVTK